MIKYACDGPDCDVVMGETELRFALHVIMPMIECVDPMSDTPQPPVPEWEKYRDQHFHSVACLTEWAFARQLNEAQAS